MQSSNLTEKDIQQWFSLKKGMQKKRKHKQKTIKLESQSANKSERVYDNLKRSSIVKNNAFYKEKKRRQPLKKDIVLLSSPSVSTKMEDEGIQGLVLNRQSKSNSFAQVKPIDFAEYFSFLAFERSTKENKNQNSCQDFNTSKSQKDFAQQFREELIKAQEIKDVNEQLRDIDFENRLNKCFGITIQEQPKETKKMTILEHQIPRSVNPSKDQELYIQFDHPDELQRVENAKYRFGNQKVVKKIEFLASKLSSSVRMRKRTVKVDVLPMINKGSKAHFEMVNRLKLQFRQRRVLLD